MSDIRLRIATLDDIPMLERWDFDPDVMASTGEEPGDPNAYDDHDDWDQLIAMHQDGVWEHWIAEVAEPDRAWRPIGAMLMIDPHLEPTHYWGAIEPGLRALDIWIGEPADRGHGRGEAMMRLAFARCFADPAVTAVIIDPLASNTRALKFYQRVGFVPTHRQIFNDEDDCLVHKLTRADWRIRFPGD